MVRSVFFCRIISIFVSRRTNVSMIWRSRISGISAGGGWGRCHAHRYEHPCRLRWRSPRHWCSHPQFPEHRIVEHSPADCTGPVGQARTLATVGRSAGGRLPSLNGRSLGGYASLQLRQHSFNGGRDCCLDRPLKQMIHLRHHCLHDVNNAGCRDVGRICCYCPLRCTGTRRLAPARFRVCRGFGRLDWDTTGVSAVRLADTACAIDFDRGDCAIFRKIQVSKVSKGSDM